jgi:hypothetical protein
VGDPARGQVELADGLFGPLTEGELEGFTTTLAEVLAAEGRDRPGRHTCGGRGSALMDLACRFSGLLRHAVVFELTMYLNLLRWFFRRPSIASGDEPVGYAQEVTPVMSLWIFASASEMPIMHVLLPWRTAQLISIVLGMWTLVWMLGAWQGWHGPAPDVRHRHRGQG